MEGTSCFPHTTAEMWCPYWPCKYTQDQQWRNGFLTFLITSVNLEGLHILYAFTFLKLLHCWWRKGKEQDFQCSPTTPPTYRLQLVKTDRPFFPSFIKRVLRQQFQNHLLWILSLMKVFHFLHEYPHPDKENWKSFAVFISFPLT